MGEIFLPFLLLQDLRIFYHKYCISQYGDKNMALIFGKDIIVPETIGNSKIDKIQNELNDKASTDTVEAIKSSLEEQINVKASNDSVESIKSSLEEQIIANANPTGTMLPYSGSSAPSGWLICDGSAISRTTYSKLFEVIGTTYGEGDESSTFNIPNMEDKTVWGASGNLGTTKSAGLPNITGQVNLCGAWYGISSSGALYTSGTSNAPSGNDTTGTGVYFNASRSNSIYGNSSTVQPPALCLNFIIKY
jgi:microcystin-dependent protein